MKLFIQIATILAVSLLVGFSQAHASDCWEEVERCQPPGSRACYKIIVTKNTPECIQLRKELRKEFGIPNIEDELGDKPKDTKSIRPTETPNLK